METILDVGDGSFFHQIKNDPLSWIARIMASPGSFWMTFSSKLIDNGRVSERHATNDGPLEEAVDNLKNATQDLGRLGLVSSGQEKIDGPDSKEPWESLDQGTATVWTHAEDRVQGS